MKKYVQTMQYWEEITTSLNNYTILITGLGGQGLIRFLEILGSSLMQKGYKVITSEKHGLSQRGGRVTCFLRFGEKNAAPIPLVGSVDMIIATEKACIFDVLEYVKPDRSSKLIVAAYEKESQSNEYPSEEYLLKVLNENSDFAYIVPVMQIIDKFKNLKVINTVILGYIVRFLPIDEDDLLASMNQHFKGPLLELNQKAFEEGRALH